MSVLGCSTGLVNKRVDSCLSLSVSLLSCQKESNDAFYKACQDSMYHLLNSCAVFVCCDVVIIFYLHHESEIVHAKQ